MSPLAVRVLVALLIVFLAFYVGLSVSPLGFILLILILLLLL